MATTYKRPVYGRKSDVPTVQVTTTLTESLLKRLDGYCFREGRRSSSVIRDLVSKFIGGLEKEQYPFPDPSEWGN
jgi:hypothetical protein